jgi:hypothetical protein
MSSASAWSSIPETSAEVSSSPAALAIFILDYNNILANYFLCFTSRVVGEGDVVGAVDV